VAVVAVQEGLTVMRHEMVKLVALEVAGQCSHLLRMELEETTPLIKVLQVATETNQHLVAVVVEEQVPQVQMVAQVLETAVTV
jgi:hypothetical protein